MVTSLAVSENGWTLLSAGRDKIVNLWDLLNYEFKLTVPTYEVLEAVRAIPTESPFAACLRSNEPHSGKKKKLGSPPIYFLTVGKRGVVRIWNSEGGACLFEQKASDATVTSDEDDTTRGFTSAECYL
ncbi:Transducin beta-like protein [Thalictrum thalictroides]|uniref:Transducin beta-like protein n=1 Tax=Thalictrum thalictroides TaxID=46969 RepID=A0A7J6WLN0_THATH|nr:Transducin beta-like protein [Thalictrum thalictroides]